MSTLIIRKKSLKTWLHIDSDLGQFIISKFYFNADGLNFQIVEQGQSKRVIYTVTDITLYDDTVSGSAETFGSITALSLRLEALNYPAFQYDGQIVSIANLIEAGTNVTISGSGTEADPYVINSSGGGGTTPTLQEVTDEGNETTNPIKVAELQLFNSETDNYARLFATGQELHFQDLVYSSGFLFDLVELTAKRTYGFVNENGDLIVLARKTTNFTAVNSGRYTANGTLTVTDPTPVTNKGYVVHVIGGTVTIGGVGYTSGALVYRYYDGSGWISTNYSQNTTATTGAVISFDKPQVYNSIASPSTSNITDDLTNAKIGVVQKIYHNHSVAPTFPAGWVRRGDGEYIVSTLNIIFAEWSTGTTVEYWITQ